MSINVLAFNCSPNEENGNTAKILNHLLDGMKGQGASVELYYTQRLTIDKCQGCTENPEFSSTGECIIVDDMKYLYPKMRNADIWIFASPNYNNTINTSLLTLFDRLEPLFEPFTTHTNGNSSNNNNSAKRKMLLISTGNQFDYKSFQKLTDHVESLSHLFNREFLGAIVRQHAWILNDHEILPTAIEKYFTDIYNAGVEIIQKGKLPKTTLKKLNKDLITKKSFLGSIVSELN